MKTRNRFKQPLALGALVISMIALAALLTTPVAGAHVGRERGHPYSATVAKTMIPKLNFEEKE